MTSLNTPLELSIVVPTFNERANVDALLAVLGDSLSGLHWEIVFVDDDSPDRTAAYVRSIALREPNVHCLQRIGRRGLSRAVIEGILATSAPYIVVMDADLQHDEKLIPQMLAEAKTSSLDFIIASRYCAGGSPGKWENSRLRMSRFATQLAHIIVSEEVSDPMSGFFLITRAAFDSRVRKLSGEGYKILLDLLTATRETPRLAEIPYTFKTRMAGESKLDSTVLIEYLLLIIDKLTHHAIPPRLVLFSLVGGSGVLVHFAVLWFTYQHLSLDFGIGQATASLVAMTSNYLLNNALTYFDRRRHGWNLLTGLLSFYLVCGIGALANVGIANYVFKQNQQWILAGIAGIVVGTVWNYAASNAITWGPAKRT
ncbi:MAG: glycosyltransferase [Bacteroidota bacterium]